MRFSSTLAEYLNNKIGPSYPCRRNVEQTNPARLQPFGQGFCDMSSAVDKRERLVAELKLRHGGNPILNMCAAGAVVQSDPAGNKKLHKAKSYSKIDGLVALAMALGCMSADDLIQPTSPWDDPDFKLAV